MRRSFGLLTMTVVVGLLLAVPVRQAAALNIDEIFIGQGTGRTNGVVDDYFFELEVDGTGITEAWVYNDTTGEDYELTNGGCWDYEANFASMPNLLAQHPGNVLYKFFFNPTVATPSYDNAAHWEDVVYLGFVASAPTGHAVITYPLHNATGVELNPTYTWNSVEGFGCDGMHMEVYEIASDNDVYDEFDNDMTRTSWQPGSLEPGKTYDIEVCIADLVYGAPTDLVTLHGDVFTYVGAFADCNENSFTTAVPEPVSMALVGTAMLALVGWRHRRRM